MSDADYNVPPLPDHAIPPFVIGREARERWELCHAIATEISREHEPAGEPSSMFVWFFTRELYQSEMRTGSAEDPFPALT